MWHSLTNQYTALLFFFSDAGENSTNSVIIIFFEDYNLSKYNPIEQYINVSKPTYPWSSGMWHPITNQYTTLTFSGPLMCKIEKHIIAQVFKNG